MSTLTIVLLSILGFILLNVIAGYIAYRKFAVPAYRPLSASQKVACARIVAEKKGYPWLCAHAVKIGKCPCMPCAKQKEAMPKI